MKIFIERPPPPISIFLFCIKMTPFQCKGFSSFKNILTLTHIEMGFSHLSKIFLLSFRFVKYFRSIDRSIERERERERERWCGGIGSIDQVQRTGKITEKYSPLSQSQADNHNVVGFILLFAFLSLVSKQRGICFFPRKRFLFSSENE